MSKIKKQERFSLPNVFLLLLLLLLCARKTGTRVKAIGGQHDTGLHQFVVELAHLGEAQREPEPDSGF